VIGHFIRTVRILEISTTVRDAAKDAIAGEVGFNSAQYISHPHVPIAAQLT